MTADHIRTIRQAIWMLVIRRTQEKRRGIDCATGNDDDFAGVSFLFAVSLNVNGSDFASGAVRFEPGDFCVGEQRYVWMFQSGQYAADMRVGFGVHQTREAVAGIATNAGALPRIFLIKHDPEWRVKRIQAKPREIVAQLLNARLVADGWKRISTGATRFSRIFSNMPVHMVDAFSLGVIGFELVVR